MTERLSTIDCKIALVALRLIATEGWPACAPARLARAAKLSPTLLAKTIDSQHDLLPLLVDYVSHETARQVGRLEPNAPLHDRLFEVMMARLDVLQTHRPAILAIAIAARRDPGMGVTLIRAQGRAMGEMLQLAGLDDQVTGPRRLFAAGGLTALYLAVLFQWQRDESADMAKTMAFLDRQLRRIGRLAQTMLR